MLITCITACLDPRDSYYDVIEFKIKARIDLI